MHAMAPGRSGVLHAGHSVGAADGGVDLLLSAGEAGGGAAIAAEPERAATRPVPEAGVAAGAAAAGWRTCAAPTRMAFLHAGHSTCFPAALSGTCMAWLQCGQRINCGIRITFLLPAGMGWRHDSNLPPQHGLCVCEDLIHRT